MPNIRWIAIALTLLLTATAPGEARRILVRPGGAAGQVGLPRAIPDAQGNQWMIYPGGWLQIQGNTPVFSQGAILNINGNQPGQQNNLARYDEKTGELLIENLVAGPVRVTRRIKLDDSTGMIRYVDVLTGDPQKDVEVQLLLQSSLNYGIQNSVTVPDPKRKNRQIGWVAMTPANKAAVEMYSGKGSKVGFDILSVPNNNMSQATMAVWIPAGKSIAIMHLHAMADTVEAGQKMLLDAKEPRIVKDLPAEIRRILINFAGNDDLIGDVEILRGDAFDVVELRAGDQYRGTLERAAYKLATPYGAVELPAAKVVGLINIGAFRPRQLVILADGQVFGGLLDDPTVNLRLSSGQLTAIPLDRISRMGYRKREGEPTEWSFDRPMVMLRGGDRVGVIPPEKPIEFVSRYGTLQLDPKNISSIVFDAENQAVHTVWLTDGGHLAGLATGDGFTMALADGGGAPVIFPAASVARIVFNRLPEESEQIRPTLTVSNGDELVGSLVGQFKLDTAFDTLAINGAEVRAMTHLEKSPLDVQVTLWDNTTVSGQCQSPTVECKLLSGMTLRVPVALVGEYDQPIPAPSAATVDRIKALAGQLADPDWKTRDRAEAELVSMGPAVLGVLTDLRPSAVAEAQQRIDAIGKQLTEQSAPKPAPPAAMELNKDDS